MGTMHNYKLTYLGALVLLFVAPLGDACGGGGDDDVVQGMPQPSQPRTPTPEASQTTAPSGGAGTTTAAQRLSDEPAPGISQLAFEGEVRDPFMRYFPEVAEAVELSASLEPLNSAREDRGPLANYTLDQLMLVGIISRTAEPRAMFRIPQSGQNVFARIDDRVGPNGTGRISDIQPNRVVVTYENIMLNADQVQTVEVLLRDSRQQYEAQFDPF